MNRTFSTAAGRAVDRARSGHPQMLRLGRPQTPGCGRSDPDAQGALDPIATISSDSGPEMSLVVVRTSIPAVALSAVNGQSAVTIVAYHEATQRKVCYEGNRTVHVGIPASFPT